MTHTMRVALLVLCTTVYLLLSPGRIIFADDEIVYQTTESLYERGSLAVAGIPKRSGEPKGRPDGTFGWAPGADGKRYGFFGHGLSIAALPLYAAGKAAIRRAPETWRHAIRSDTYFLHRRSPQTDWPRLFVSLTNCGITALAALVLAQWLTALGYGARIAVATALSYAFATSAWAYSGTFLSEPLSALMLLVGAWAVTRFLAERDARPRIAARWLLLGAAVVGASVHTHVLNLLAVPAYLLWLGVALGRDGVRKHRSALVAALAIGAVALAALGVSNAMRFGSPGETGRVGHYSRFVLPFEGLAAMVVAPGRSIFIYSPALLVALWGVAALRRNHRAVAVFIAAFVLLRWSFVAARSDWWGGWAIGPRYLLPLVPFMLVPLAEVFAAARRWSGPARAALGTALLGCIALGLHLAKHNIFEHMVNVARGYETNAYLDVSHWRASASPIVGFVELPVDTLSNGALQLARHGHDGLLWVFGGVAVTGTLAALVLGLALLGRRSTRAADPPSRSHAASPAVS
ncbi:MAG: DUF2723 domain-containing protein [Myxococcota bacterium]